MYINNLKQKQKYLEKLKNKLIKLEKKENSTSIFSKLFRRQNISIFFCDIILLGDYNVRNKKFNKILWKKTRC